MQDEHKEKQHWVRLRISEITGGRPSTKETWLWINSFCPTVLCRRGGQKKETRKSAWETAAEGCSGSLESCQLFSVMHGTGGNNCCPTSPTSRGLSLHCHGLSPAQGAQELPASHLAHEPCDVAGALHSARGATTAHTIRS